LGGRQARIRRKIGEFLLEFRDELGQLASPEGGQLGERLSGKALQRDTDGLKQSLIGQCAIGGIGSPLQGPNPPAPPLKGKGELPPFGEGPGEGLK
jgi:hypothetical protein